MVQLKNMNEESVMGADGSCLLALCPGSLHTLHTCTLGIFAHGTFGRGDGTSSFLTARVFIRI